MLADPGRDFVLLTLLKNWWGSILYSKELQEHRFLEMTQIDLPVA
jgi:hypothetical protein